MNATGDPQWLRIFVVFSRAGSRPLVLLVQLIQRRGTLCFYCLVRTFTGDFTHKVLCKVHQSLPLKNMPWMFFLLELGIRSVFSMLGAQELFEIHPCLFL